MTVNPALPLGEKVSETATITKIKLKISRNYVRGETEPKSAVKSASTNSLYLISVEEVQFL
jgi:hypothetical protein